MMNDDDAARINPIQKRLWIAYLIYRRFYIGLTIAHAQVDGESGLWTYCDVRLRSCYTVVISCTYLLTWYSGWNWSLETRRLEDIDAPIRAGLRLLSALSGVTGICRSGN